MRYERVARVISETPWMIRPAVLEAIVELVTMRINGERLSASDIEARIGAGPSTRQPEQHGAIALIPIYGVIIPKATMFSDISGGTSIASLQSMFRAALNNDRVGSILFDIDSPGGAVAMVPEMAAEIRDARGTKPIVAIANTMAASAAYYLGSQADEFVVTPSGQVGSIGVVTAHDNEASMWEMAGIETTLVTAGKYKAELSSLGPLSDDARAYLQDRVNTYYEMFVSDVARGRGTTAALVREGYGEGRMLLASDAKRAGMVDRIETFDQVLTRMAGGGARSRRVKAELAAEDPIDAMNAEIARANRRDALRAHGIAAIDPEEPEEPVDPEDDPEPDDDEPEAVALSESARIAMADRDRRLHLAARR